MVRRSSNWTRGLEPLALFHRDTRAASGPTFFFTLQLRGLALLLATSSLAEAAIREHPGAVPDVGAHSVPVKSVRLCLGVVLARVAHHSTGPVLQPPGRRASDGCG